MWPVVPPRCLRPIRPIVAVSLLYAAVLLRSEIVANAGAMRANEANSGGRCFSRTADRRRGRWFPSAPSRRRPRQPPSKLAVVGSLSSNGQGANKHDLLSGGKQGIALGGGVLGKRRGSRFFAEKKHGAVQNVVKTLRDGFSCRASDQQSAVLSPSDGNRAIALMAKHSDKGRSSEEESLDDPRRRSRSSLSSKFWPPWPFNLLSNAAAAPRGGDNEGDLMDAKERTSYAAGYKDGAALFWAYFRQRSMIATRQLRDLGSDVLFHLPPNAPPLLLLAVLPAKVTGEGATALKSFMPLSHVVARKLALASLGVAVLSWAQFEVSKTKRLAPLPLSPQYKDYKRAVLPPFLPEALLPLELDPILVDPVSAAADDAVQIKSVMDEVEETVEGGLNSTSGFLSVPNFKRQLRHLYKATPKPETLAATVNEWKKLRHIRRREKAANQRKAIMEELTALNMLKKKAAARSSRTRLRSRNGHSEDGLQGTDKNEPSLGFALVTGASRGIGRAIAVELARWEVPLVLVARNLDELTALADDLEAFYGVKCCVLVADLSSPGAAERVYQATKSAGLTVDILVNNAGVCSRGELVESAVEDIERMVQINAMSVAVLSKLYGRDMKKRGRGRMMFVSSVTGAAPATPYVSTYAATKAFEKTLALSMGKELEPYGVGVTCLMPGAVRGTAFATSSEIEDAVCWKVPFYPRTAPEVAHTGVRSLLWGDVEVFPGWQNRVFVRLAQPMLPQRLSMLVTEFAWNPFRKPKIGVHPLSESPSESSSEHQVDRKGARTSHPRRLLLPENESFASAAGNGKENENEVCAAETLAEPDQVSSNETGTSVDASVGETDSAIDDTGFDNMSSMQ